MSFCASNSLIQFVSYWGLDNPNFTRNPYLVRGNVVCDRFVKSIQALQSLPRVGDSTLQVVFHGTRYHNIESILRNGLDPKKRRKQAYGPGEYFGKNPPISVSYCHDDLTMLVLVVTTIMIKAIVHRISWWYLSMNINSPWGH
jgi:Poly(ADP-ribose) polymerase catalytic domain